MNLQKRKHEYPEKKGQGVKRKYDDKKESVKRYMKKNKRKIEHQMLHIKKQNIRKTLKCDCYIKTTGYQENTESKIIYQNTRCQENCENK